MKDSKAKRPVFRAATLEDVPEIARRLKRLWQKIEPAYHGISWDHESSLVTIDHAIRFGVCIVGDTSCAGAVFSPFLWNHSETVADIAFWTFDRPRESAIFRAICVLCKASGATYIKANTHWPDNRIARFYTKRGFGPSETGYLANAEKCCKAMEKD